MKRHWGIVAVVLLGSWGLLTEIQIIRRYPLTWHWPWPQVDCGVALTGGRGRIPLALEVFRRQWVRKLLISGASDRQNIMEWLSAWDILLRPDMDLWIEDQSSSTRENAQTAFQWFHQHQCYQLAVITSRTHMPRVMLYFRLAGFEPWQVIPLSLPPSYFESHPAGLVLEAVKLLWAHVTMLGEFF